MIDRHSQTVAQPASSIMFLGRVLRGLTALLTLAAVPAAAYPDPIACTGACWAHDPGVVKRADGKYFRFGTGSKIGIWTASSLTGSWTYQGAAIPAGSSINLPGNDDLWVSFQVQVSALQGVAVQRILCHLIQHRRGVSKFCGRLLG